MKKTILIGLFSIGVHLLAFVLANVVRTCFRNGFDGGDTFSLVFWSIPLALAVSLWGPYLVSLITTPQLNVVLLIILALAIVATLGWYYLFCWLWGMHVNPLIWSIFYFWIAGSFAQLSFLKFYK